MFCVSIPRNREIITFLVYLSLFLDNVLLTVIVPILPDFLVNQQQITIPQTQNFNATNTKFYKNFDLHYVPGIMARHPHAGNLNLTKIEQITISTNPKVSILRFEEENGSIGILLAVKAFVQLAFNPIVGIATQHYGYRIPIFIGTISIFISSMVFAVGQSYGILFFARALQGIGSACIGVCGMSLVAQLYQEEDKRSKVMGIVLGSIALGVLIGYPFGGILYDFYNKSTPFYIIGIFLIIVLVFQFIIFDFTPNVETPHSDSNNIKWWPLLSDKMIFLIACAIWVSTSAMAILEPCLPIWLLSHLNPKKWQLGTVFIPDSIGYLIGTNFFGSIAYKIGQIKISITALTLVGISCVTIPAATTVIGLLLPHFGLGLGIGVLDAALVPLLAAVVDSKYASEDETVGDCHYGAVYAIQQTAVSLAYSIAPMIGGELAQSIGFSWLMRIIGFINLLYGPILIFWWSRLNLQTAFNKPTDILLNGIEIQNKNNYKKFYNSID